MGWVKVTDKLPSLEEQSGIIYDGKNVCWDVLYLPDLKVWAMDDSDEALDDITHWYRMPKPPVDEIEVIST